ncbi:MAG: hypothetical protein LBN23_05130 [Paludibacter sp.]|jgi:hypothetical protein|nr:hypothetical protein [Paludibacter sp.]
MRIGLVSCVKKKINDGKGHCAKDLYCSTLFAGQLKLSQTENEKTFILSAKYGLLELDDMISYYDETLIGKPKAEKDKWADGVVSQLESKKIAIDGTNDFVFYAGNDYFKPLLNKVLKSNKRFNLPIGKLLQKLKEVNNG